MIKLNRGVAEKVYLSLLYMFERGFPAIDCQNEAYRYKDRHGEPMKNICSTITHNGFGDNPRWEDMLTPLRQALLGQGAQDAHHPALIDRIVDILEGPYAKNVLGQRALNDLRRAILLPEEMTKVGESMRKEMACANCGMQFHNNEVATAYVSDVGGPMAFYCYRCMHPSQAPCQNPHTKCASTGEIDTRILGKMVGKARCDDHSGKPKTEPERALDLNGDAPPPAQDAIRGAWINIPNVPEAPAQPHVWNQPEPDAPHPLDHPGLVAPAGWEIVGQAGHQRFVRRERLEDADEREDPR